MRWNSSNISSTDILGIELRNYWDKLAALNNDQSRYTSIFLKDIKADSNEWTLTLSQNPTIASLLSNGITFTYAKIGIFTRNPYFGTFDLSDTPFGIVSSTTTPSITVLSPNGGETWQIGQSKKISWSMENIPSTAVLYLSLVSGPTPIDLESVNPIGSTNSVDLVLPSGGCFGDVCYPGGILPGNYKISATVYDKPNPGFAISVVPDSSYTQPKIIASDVSDVSFSVVAAVGTKTAPTMTLTANPMTVNSGQSTQLSWTSTNATSCVPTSNIGYWGVSVGGSTTGPIYTTTTFTVVCSSPGGSTSKSVTVTVTSTPSITVLSPNGGETWTLGTTRTITWSSNNIPSNHLITNIELVNSSGGRYSVLDTTPNDGAESAFLPFFIPQGTYRLEIMTALNGQAIVDKSDGPITIIGATSEASVQTVNQMASALEAGRQVLLELLKLFSG